MNVLRQKIVEKLAFPRLLALGIIESEDCPYDLRFQPDDVACGACKFASECEWLDSDASLAMLARRPETELVQDLRFAIDYVRGVCDRANHSPSNCLCDACRWLVSARRLLKRAEGNAIVAH